MKLQAYIQDGAGGMAALTPSASGVQVSSGYYIAADVDALLASIRAAVAAERVCADKLMDYPPVPWGHTGTARAALDALLSGEG